VLLDLLVAHNNLQKYGLGLGLVILFALAYSYSIVTVFDCLRILFACQITNLLLLNVNVIHTVGRPIHRGFVVGVNEEL